MTSPQTPAGWYQDPEGSGQQRYWDGQGWTQHYSGGGAPAAGQQAPGYAQHQQGYPQAGAPGYVQSAPKTPPGPAPAAWWGVPVLALLAIIGAAGLWQTGELGGREIDSANGLSGDGWFTLILVLIAVGLLVVWRQGAQRWAAITAGVLSLLAALFPLIYIIDPKGTASGLLVDTVDWSTGWGAYLAFVASLALAALSFFLSAQRRRAD